ncbi:MAG: response regulator [Desulfobacteraceae bacterium]|nr:response regulator [Desulfobacteraceae bacterium]
MWTIYLKTCACCRESWRPGEARGGRVRAALSGPIALEAIRHQLPDLVILDIRMPDMDGFEVCRRLKADPALREIPIIFISARHELTDKVKAFSMGGVDYLGKPPGGKA